MGIRTDNGRLASIEGGGVTSAQGFRAGGIHAGFRNDPTRLDLALVEADELCPTAGVFTQNVFCAAPVIVSKEHLGTESAGVAKAVIINSGNANAATGARGLADARKSAELAADAVGCAAEDIIVASTGVIGVFLPLEPFDALFDLHESLSVGGGHEAARAIMTTDTVSKECAVDYVSTADPFVGTTFTVGGMVKGSGMIMPNMATMICVLTTDAPVPSHVAKVALLQAVGESFNKVTVDSDTSTNDTCILMASGKATRIGAFIEEGTTAFREFLDALRHVCVDLARQIARDGEGATKLVTVNVTGAGDDADADRAARSIANSPLVKTAISGHDANWGRIAAALGKSGACFDQLAVDIDIMGIPVCRSGLSVAFDEDDALARFEADEIVIDCDLHAGSSHTTIWTCDFTHEYISINGDYRS